MAKKRLDVLLVERGLVDSRQKAQAVIMAGEVFVDGQKVNKAGSPTSEESSVEVRGNTLRYVSRGGLKLEKATAEFPIDLHGKIAADIGASTGGFTDCMLRKLGRIQINQIDLFLQRRLVAARYQCVKRCLQGAPCRINLNL